ncbi:mitogen-activated protein kinase kinase kinase 3-like [Physella acuta]|uniref:mitogen-activated protein kinase kinase kinase 3-like n=1 Tax=Physella acuta TaxID=109671 RepID=UPI0027DD5147|nr:mitogen-activated protein kinase kinase kinase 3-like [Physella acuta]XP_059160974.1 mitogen-activated protein kinase kinase kinase 3-like [Physella acuta]XP_059160975.1 mitogen-activated protein kinase kinase kinase 3-like [Physella acuta]
MTGEKPVDGVARMDKDLNDDDPISDVVACIQQKLETGLKQGNKQARRVAIQHLHKTKELKVKCEFGGEKRMVTVPRPVKYPDLVRKLQELFKILLNIFYTQSNGEMYIPLKNQAELDAVLRLLDQNEHSTSLRLYLTPAVAGTEPSSTQSHSTVAPVRQSPSPPPGSLPHVYHGNSSYAAVEGEGAFIPEPSHADTHTFHHHREGSMSDSLSSIDSSYISGHDSYGRRRDSHRSALSEGPKDEVESRDRSKRFGTFPRGFDNQETNTEINGRQTFPRSRRLDYESSSIMSLMSHSSEGTLDSQSSSSSGFPADGDWDSPGGRYSMSGPMFSKSPRAPTNWRRGKLLGSGAFGEVYLCCDTDSSIELAVKQVLLGNMNAEVSKEVRALENELQLLRNFQHERIVQYYGCQEENRVLSIFMEYMAGGSVLDHIKQYGPLTERVASKYTRQMLQGLAFLHKNVIVHRDLKAANVLRDTQGNVKLGDFGASKRLQTITSATGLRTAIGTPHWMAPEVISGDGYGRKADVWSLGCTVVEMLTLKPPYADYEPFAAMFQIATNATPKYELPAGTSVLVKDFLALTFQRTPTKRPSAEDLMDHRFVKDLT